MSHDPPYWGDSEHDDAAIECDLGVLRLIITGNENGKPGPVRWECHWDDDWDAHYADTLEQAKRDAKAFALELLAQVTAQLTRLEP